MSAFDGLEANQNELLANLLADSDPQLLEELRAQEPDVEQRRAVMRILSDAFTSHLQPDWEPDDRGVAIDDLLGKFLLRFPIEQPGSD